MSSHGYHRYHRSVIFVLFFLYFGSTGFPSVILYYIILYFKCNLTNYEGENSSDSSFHHILESENFRFPFFYEK